MPIVSAREHQRAQEELGRPLIRDVSFSESEAEPEPDAAPRPPPQGPGNAAAEQRSPPAVGGVPQTVEAVRV